MRAFRWGWLLLLLSMLFLPMDGGAEQGITIIYEGNAQYELISTSGRYLLTDVYDPDKLSRPVDKNDVLLTTHHHWDHYHKEFAKLFPGTHLDRVGKWRKQGLTIRAIRASHSSVFAEPLDNDDQMLIYCVEVQGFRIVHMGDTAQFRLNKEQLRYLKDVDVVITNLRYDPRGYLDPIGFGPLEQIKPKLVIPSHVDKISGEYARKKWRGYRWSKSAFILRESDLRGVAKIVFIGLNARDMQHLQEWK